MKRATVAVLIVVLTAGCLGGGPVSDEQTATPTASPTGSESTATPTSSQPESCPPTATPTEHPTPGTETPRAGTPTATTSGFTFGPDRETPVVLSNQWSRQVEMQVHVSCATTSETIHEKTYVLRSGDRLDAFDLTTATPEGTGSSITVAVTVRNTTDRVTLGTADCADVTGRVRDDGSLRVWASGC